MVKIYDDETLEDLTKFNMKIIQKKEGFRFSLDAILIANFIKVDRNIEIMDIGTGTGIIPLLLANNEKIKKIIGVEIQDIIADMARRSIIMNNLENKIEIKNEDINNYKIEKKVDMIITNPPYMKIENGKISENLIKAISRHEVKLNLESLIKSAKMILKDGGSFNIIYRTKRFQELIKIITDNRFFIKRLRFIYTKPDKDSDLFMLEAIKNQKKDIKIEKPLNIYNATGDYSKEVESYY